MGVARNGGYANHLSGEFALAFSTVRHHLAGFDFESRGLARIEVLPNLAGDSLFAAAVEATQEAILNALLAAQTMEGRDGFTAYRLEPDRLRQCVRAFRGD